MAQATYPGAPAPFVVRYSRKALVSLLAFDVALMTLGHYLLTAGGFGLAFRLAGIAVVAAGVIVMAHALRYLVSPRLVTILPTGLVYHGMVKPYRADWSEISGFGAGEGEEAGDSVTFHATGPFGMFGKFAINEMLIGGPKGDLASISEALYQARFCAAAVAQFGTMRPPPR